MPNIEVLFGDCVRDLKKLEVMIGKRGEDIVRFRFKQGCILKDVIGTTKYGDNAVEKIASEVNVPESTLRIAYGVARQFNFKDHLLDKKIDDLKEAGKTINYGYFRGMLKEDSNPDVHGSPEKHKQHLLNKVDGASGALQEASEHYKGDQEVAGAAMQFAQSIEEAEFTILPTIGEVGKGKAWTNAQLEAYVRSLSCCVPNCTNKPSEFNHTVPKSQGALSSSLWGTPLCTGHHTNNPDSYHVLGKERFEEYHGIKMIYVIIGVLQGFIDKVTKKGRF